MEVCWQIKEKIEDADMVLIGIGEELQLDVDQLLGQEQDVGEDSYAKGVAWLKALQKKEKPEIQEALSFYHELDTLLQKKDYFVVSMCDDDVITESCLDQTKVVCPCGTRKKMQCSTRCVDEVLDTEESKDAVLCPHCGEKMAMNLLSLGNYSEAGYMPQWTNYQKWLTKTLNHKLLILELGVGFRYPSVIRWPFEKVVAFNQKANMVRVNQMFPQIAEEIKEKAVSIPMDSRVFIHESLSE